MAKTVLKIEKAFVLREEELEIELGIISLSGVSDVNWEYGKLRKVNFINFSKDGLQFRVRIPRHSVPNIPRGISYNGGVWEVDANTKFYDLEDVIKAVKNLCYLQGNLDIIRADLRELAVNDNRFEPIDDMDVWYLTPELVKKYFADKQVEDNKHGSIHYVVRDLSSDVLEKVYIGLDLKDMEIIEKMNLKE